MINGSYVKTPSCQSCPKPGGHHEDNWVYSPQGTIAMHQPETWAILQLAEAGTPLREYDEWPTRALASALYHAEHRFRDGGGKPFTASIEELDQHTDPPGLLKACAVGAVVTTGGLNGTNFTASLGNIARPGLVATITDLRFTTVERLRLAGDVPVP